MSYDKEYQDINSNVNYIQEINDDYELPFVPAQ